ncbi:hypothetical protein NUW58_g989 [Xylaria curta]|uniref:Uncharacterized protein n=1 Tax=Xylaria curta TaxID=42375 RepID=A0ACC1PNR7_9PEZI|nr:hypothetical protein NUW58_g989 [Xylaria curta]
MQELKPLYNQIDEAFATSEFDKQPFKFLPDGVIDSLIIQANIVWAFKPKKNEEDFSKAWELADSIVKNGLKKVFATAVMIGLTGDDLRRGMQKLKDAGISDSTLPAKQGDFSQEGMISSPPRTEDEISTESFEGTHDDKIIGNKDADNQKALFDYWKGLEEDDTDEWLFLSPVFSTSSFVHNFDQFCIMPFTEKHSECDSGAFGQVTKYKIHKSHLINPGDPKFECPEFVAAKELAVKNKEDRQNILNTWGKEAKALQKMNALKQSHIVGFYTAFLRGIPGAQDHYLMLEWASGGNLRNFWKNFKRPALTSELVRATVYQILGLVKAINKAHYPESGPNFRHGDLKPENILWFKDDSGHGIGTFKIGDWGLAKQHFRVTEMRSRRTTTKWGTRRYEPPEEADSQGANLLTSDQSGKRRSRLYDIWALGCITLEFLIWLMYGVEELDRFNKGLEVSNSDNSRFYLIKPVTGGRPDVKVHDVAVEWMKHMGKDPICKPGRTALGNLLELVETRLLVVQLPERLGTSISFSRDAEPPENDIQIINNSSILMEAHSNASPSGSHDLPTIVVDDPEPNKVPPRSNTPTEPRPRAPGRERARAGELLDQMLIMSGEDEEESYWFTGDPNPPRGPNVDEIRQRLEYLPIGSLSLGGTERPFFIERQGIQFDTMDSDLDLGLDIGTNEDIQIGYPSLTEAGSEAYFEILRRWLELCDRDHKDTTCRPGPQISNQKMIANSTLPSNLPTRVIRVGKKGDDKVYLHETSPGDNGEWIALSHQWGTGEKFCTTTKTLDAHINGMDFGSLPETFKHAIVVTRALGRQYLWIDSLCIVQGDDGDFSQEAKRMEQVYKGAYCVLASSRPPGHYAGFLQARKQRNTVALQQNGKSVPFYICEAIDDFSHHVLGGALNKRGWVLQEHALARRTIYFTDHQTYFECGDGVRCETMTKMKNEVATFLGDPNFPEIIMRASQGEIILRYQDLYKKYSRLGLSHLWDRTMAIDGLQTQILKALNAKGGYGILDKGKTSGGLLRRSLLWRRDDDTPAMSTISLPKHHPIAKVPSWSWMAYAGSIDYISPPFGGVNWEKMQSPWSSNMSDSGSEFRTDNTGGNIALVAEAREYDAHVAIRDGDGDIVLDNPRGPQQRATECVVLGVKKGMADLKKRTHYLLVVMATSKLDRNGLKVYERVGAGYLPGNCIGPTGHMISIH